MTSPSTLENGFPSANTRLALYRDMLRVRLVEEEIIKRYGEQEMRCPTHICIGQEAAPAGVSTHLRREDEVYSAHRSHGHYLSKGASLKGMIAELYGRETGCALGMGGSQHLIDLDAGFMGSAPILASTISVGVGSAWTAKRRGHDKVIVIYFGDGATEEGAFHEAANFAGVNKLPVVFVCENNLYSVHTPLEIRQPNRKISELAGMHGVRGLIGDGNDVDAVWRLAEVAIQDARNGNGPSLIELATYRWKEHCGPNEDQNLGYRSDEEMAEWVEKCPLARYEKILVEENQLSEAIITKFHLEIAQEIDEAFDFAKSSAYPKPEMLSRFVYPEMRESS